MKKYKNLLKLKNSKSVCIIGHLSPDADALASMIVLKHFLLEKFKIKTIDLYTDYETIDDPCLSILGSELLNPTNISQYDAAIMVDCPNIDRLGKFKHLFETAKTTFLIDHHSTNTMCADYNLLEILSSTCEIVYQIVKEFKYNLSTKDKENLYAGIITDTNNFTTPNTTKKTFNTVSEIVEHIDHTKIYNDHFNNFSLTNLTLYGIAINNITTLESGKIITTFVDENDLNQHKANSSDLTGIIGRIATTKNNLLTCFIYPKNNMYYVSLRARNGFDVSVIAKKYGGGGHVGASGFMSNLEIDEIVKLINSEFLTQIKKIN